MKVIISFFFWFFAGFVGYSQIGGQTAVTAGQSYTYTFTTSTNYSAYLWYDYNDYGIVSQAIKTATGYSCIVTWNISGSTTLRFSAFGSIVGSLSITVNCPTLSQPVATFSYPNGTNSCGSATISYTQDPPPGVKWYWQTTSSGTSKTNATKIITATTTGTYYLRANCGNGWSSAKQTSGITITPLPTVTASNSAICSGTGSNIMLTNDLPGTTNTWTVSTTNATGASNGSGVSGSGIPYIFIINQPLTASGNINGTASYKITPSKNGCSGSTTTVTVTVKPLPIAAAADQAIFTNHTTSIGITNTNNISGTSFSWVVGQSNVSGGSNGSGTSIAQNLTAGVLNGSATYTITPTANGCNGPVVDVIATVYAAPQITSLNGNRVVMGEAVNMDGGSFYSSWLWKNTANSTVPLGNQQIYSTNIIGYYQVTVTKSGVIGSATSPVFSVVDQFNGQNLNYVVSNTFLVPTSDVSESKYLPVESLTQAIQYHDGLGRPMQSVITQGSNGKKDFVQPVIYDNYGRQVIHHLPYSEGKDGWYKNNPLVSQRSFYNNPTGSIPRDDYPYSEVTFENSALGKVLKNYGAGSAWRSPNVAADKNIEHQYLVNVHGALSGQERIIAWRLGSSSMLERCPAKPGFIESGGYYSSEQLIIKCTKDEQGHEIREYTNKNGQLILKKVQAVANALPAIDSYWAQTYYVYDDFGNLAIVLPPEAVSSLLN